jgi:two-component system sensor kinase
MMLDARLAELLLRWERLRAQGQVVSPEELCRGCPDMLDELIKGMHALPTIHTLHATPRESAGAPTPRGYAGLPSVGDYQVLGELGRGGMGVVYQAFDRKRRQMVALKTLQSVDPSALYRLKQEFRALAEVTHPNLVALYELLSVGPQCFLAMELVDGEHFLRHIRADTGDLVYQTVDLAERAPAERWSAPEPSVEEPYSLSAQQCDRLRAVLRQLAQAITYLHTQGKVHRDIKPSNVMVTPAGRAVVLDFGLSAQLDWAGIHQSTELHVTGTIAYMAPEQAASQAQSTASDWYSIGVMMYEALTGRLPFAGTPFQVLMDKQKREPLPPSELVRGVPEDLNSLCLALLRRHAPERPKGPEVLQRLGNHAPTAPVPSRKIDKGTFVGRERQLADLTGAFQVVRKGHAAVVRIAGRSGAGKSMLAQHFLDDLVQHGEAVVLSGKCYERESVPYKALDSLIDALTRYLRRLPPLEVQALLPREVHLLTRVFPVLQRVAAVAEAPGRAGEVLDPHDLRRRAFGALRELLARMGDRKPLVLFIDDLQWGDLDGATQLAALVEPPDPPVLLLLACYRSEDVDTSTCLGVLNRALAKAGSALDQRQVAVEPFSKQEACDLVLALLGRNDESSEAFAEAIARESGGNPFFVHVLVQCLTTESADHPSLTGDLTLDQVLWTRIQTLPEQARRLLEVIAVSGQPLRLIDACHTAGHGAEEHGAMAELRSYRLVRSIGQADIEEVETYHDRVRETTLNHLAPEVIQDLHRRIAIVLEASVSAEQAIPALSDGSPARAKLDSKRLADLAYHFDAAGDSVRALPYALAMAEQARAQYALEIAEQLYQIAERGAQKMDDATRYRVAESLGDVLMLRGRYPDAAIRLKAALALTTDTLTQARTEGKLAELAFKVGDVKTATDATERALRMLGNRIPTWSIAFFFCLLWEALVQALHTVFPRLFLARKKLEGAENQLLSARLFHRLTYCYWFGKGKIPCLWSHLRGMNLAEVYPPTLELAQTYMHQAPVMSLLGYFSRGIAYSQKAVAICASLGNLWGQGQALSYSGLSLYVASRFRECIEKCSEAASLLERTGDVWEVNIARYHIANSLYRLGDLSGAVAEARRIHQSGLEIGDIQALGICFDVWVLASGGQVKAEALQTELQRQRADVQVSAQLMLAEGLRLFMLGRVMEAAMHFENGQRLAETAGVQNAWTFPLRSWLASALRRQAEETPDATSRQALLKQAGKVAGKALKVARTFQNDLPHALRECGLIAALQGQVRQAREYLDESLAVAERQGARFENAKTLLARGRVGQQHGWPEAPQDLTTARQSLRELGADAHIPNSDG